MLYHITRGGQSYGPYTLADLGRYLASGHVLPTDLCKSDDMAEWLPVSQVLSSSGLPPAAATAEQAPSQGIFPQQTYPQQTYPQQTYGAPASAYPDPPNLHWGLVLLFDCLTFGVFQIVWNFVLSAWMKRVLPGAKAFLYYAAGYGLLLLSSGLSFPSYVAALHHTHLSGGIFSSLIGIIGWVFRLLARFEMKNSLEQHFNSSEPINFQMSGVLTFFFGGLYIQSQINRINDIKQSLRYRDFGR